MISAYYLAMTGQEIAQCNALPAKIAWMACHFSPYGTGLCNLPETLPEDAMLILNDRIPFWNHDPQRIKEQLRTVEFSCLLLDFQRADVPGVNSLVQLLAESITAPVAVSEPYSGACDCPVFLSPVPPYCSVQEHLAPWQGRDIWLDVSVQNVRCTLRDNGALFQNIPPCSIPEPFFRDEALHCRYHMEAATDHADIVLSRDRNDLETLLSEATERGVLKAVGLYQELKEFLPEATAG